MQILFFVLLILSACTTKRNPNSLHLEPGKCQSLDWVTDDERTQGGGWIWYLGKGLGSTQLEAVQSAEFGAIRNLIQECRFPHANTRFIERCSENWGDQVVTYVRASLKNQDCETTKKLGPADDSIVSQSLYRQYLSTLYSRDQNEENCNSSKPEKCLRLGRRLFENNRITEALAALEIACNNRVEGACLLAGIAKSHTGDVNHAQVFFQRGCEGNDQDTCYLLSKAKGDEEELKLMCESGYPKACGDSSLAGELLERARAIGLKSNLEHNQLTNLCSQGDGIACAALGTKFSPIDPSLNDKKFLEDNCFKRQVSISCFNLGERFFTMDKHPLFSKDNFKDELKGRSSLEDTFLNKMYDQKIKAEDSLPFVERCLQNSKIDCFIAGYASHVDLDFYKTSQAKKIFAYLYKDLFSYFKTRCLKEGILCNEFVRVSYSYFLADLSKGYNQIVDSLCDKNVASACQALGVRYENLDQKKNAENAYRTACEAGNSYACESVAKIHLNRGEDSEWKKYGVLSCQKDDRSTFCYELYDIINDTPNRHDKFALMNYGCNEVGDERICELLISQSYNLGSIEISKKTAGRMCELQQEGPCRLLSQIYFTEGKKNAALEVLKRICYSLDKVNGCYEYGTLSAHMGNRLFAESILEKFCERGSPSNCEAALAVKQGKKPLTSQQIYQVNLKNLQTEHDTSWKD